MDDENDATVDLDGLGGELRGWLGGFKEVARADLEHAFMRVQEIILEWGDPKKRRLLWTRSPFEKVQVDGRLNLVFHSTYDPALAGDKERARAAVRRAFTRHYRDVAASGVVDAEKCKHASFDCRVTVNRLEDIGRFQADVTVRCIDCGTPFRFIGLPAGLDLNGAAVSVDGTEGRFAIAPKGEVVTPLDAVGGFTVRRTK